MKPFILFVVLLFAVTGCTEQPAAPSPSGTVSLSFVEADQQAARLMLVNGTDKPVIYHGWSEENPLKMVEVRTDTGWCTVAWDWCGTGAMEYRVAPLSAAVVTAPVMRRNLPTRVSFGYTQTDQGEYRTLYSNEFIVP